MGLPPTYDPVVFERGTTVGRDLIDGIPVFWDETTGPLTVSLMFRVGQADESLRTHGLTRLVEHLVRFAAGLDHPPLVAGGNQLVTTFTFTGTDAESVEYLGGLARAIAALPLDRITWAADILRAETRPPSDWSIHLQALRHGPQGFGIAAFDELGLIGMEPAAVDRWHRTRFNASNAVLVCSRRPPGDIDLSLLPKGERQPSPVLPPTAIELPASYPGPHNGVAVGFEIADGPAVRLATQLVQERLTKRLTDGTANVEPPRVSVDMASLGTGTVCLAYFVGVANGSPQEVQSAMSAALFKLGMSGPTSDELGLASDHYSRQRAAQPSGTPSPAQTAATQVLLGGDFDPIERGQHIAEVTATDIARLVRTMIPGAIWLMPPGASIVDQRIVQIPIGSTTSVEGNPFLPVPTIAGARRGDRLIVGTDGITQQSGGNALLSIAFDDCAALQVWSDGSRTLWNSDGIRLFVHPSSWQGGDQVVTWIDSQIGPSLVVPMAVSSGYVLPIDPT